MEQFINMKKFWSHSTWHDHTAQLEYSNRQDLCSEGCHYTDWLRKLISSVFYNARTLLCYMEVCVLETIYSRSIQLGWQHFKKGSGIWVPFKQF